jgi:hypothetical protein
MGMTGSAENFAMVFLSTNNCPRDPRVLQNFCQDGPFLRINLQHTPNNVSTLSGKKS